MLGKTNRLAFVIRLNDFIMIKLLLPGTFNICRPCTSDRTKTNRRQINTEGYNDRLKGFVSISYQQDKYPFEEKHTMTGEESPPRIVSNQTHTVRHDKLHHLLGNNLPCALFV